MTDLLANAQGQLTGRFTIPASVPAGSKLLRFLGDQGSYGEATFIGQGQLTVQQMRQVITKFCPVPQSQPERAVGKLFATLVLADGVDNPIHGNLKGHPLVEKTPGILVGKSFLVDLLENSVPVPHQARLYNYRSEGNTTKYDIIVTMGEGISILVGYAYYGPSVGVGWTGNYVPVYAPDPLAQTFSVPQAIDLTGVDLWFTAKGTSNVLVQIRETTIGFPNHVVLSEILLTPAQIGTNGPTRCSWPALRLESNVEYALVVACNDVDTALAIAELGKFDSIANRWITAQPYQVGVLLSSSNASTWTAHQDRDLAFRLLTAPFSATTRTIDLNTVAVTDAAELMVLAAVERPTTDTDVRFELTLPDIDATVITVTENQSVTLAAPITGDIAWRAILTGTATATPRLYPDVQLAWGACPTTSDYITRSIPLQKDLNATSKLSVYFEALTPGGSTVTVDAQNANETWTAVPVDSGLPIGDGWEEVKHVLTGFTDSSTRIRLTLTGSSQQRPRVRKLRVIAT